MEEKRSEAAVEARIWFAEKLADQGLAVGEEQLDLFERYYELLTDWNERMNLTAITGKDEVYAKHFFDSLTVAMAVPVGQMKTAADIGTGAGFPGLPLKILFPRLKLLLVDSLRKRIQFLEHAAAELGLKDVVCLHGRAEDLARRPDLRDRFDLVTARAVARLNVLGELCLPFVRPGGSFVAMKGPQGREELAEAERGIRLLRARVAVVRTVRLPLEDAERTLIVLEKTGSTPDAYPRRAGIPARNPL